MIWQSKGCFLSLILSAIFYLFSTFLANDIFENKIMNQVLKLLHF